MTSATGEARVEPAVRSLGGALVSTSPHLIVMAVLFVAAAVVAWLVLPGEDERIAALERDGQMQRARQMLEARFAGGDRRPRTLYQLQRLYEFYGDRDRARQVLELLASQRPRDAFVQRQLAFLYKQTQDEPAYIGALQAQLRLRYSEPACRELIGILRRDNRYGDEQQAILTCRGQGYRRVEDLIRLAYLQAADGNLKDAAQALSAVDDRRWLKESRERLMLFSSLVETGQQGEAVRRGVRWLKGQPDTDLALEMIYKFSEAGQNDLGIRLARDVGTAGDSVSLAVGEIMVDQTQLNAARAYLAGWLEQAKQMNGETLQRFVTAAIDAEDPLLALRGAERQGVDRLDAKSLIALAEALAGRGNMAELDRVRVHLDPDLVRADPMLAAAVEIRQGRVETARAYLSRVRIDELDERRLGFYARIAEMAGRPPASPAVLRPRTVAAVAPNASPAGEVVAATPARPGIVGPAQARAKRIVKQRADAKQTAKAKRRVTAPADQATAPGSGGFLGLPQTAPFKFPVQQ